MLRGAPSLQELGLRGCDAGDKGAASHSSSLESQSCCPLKKLFLVNDGVGDNGISATAAAPHGSNAIEELGLLMQASEAGDCWASALAKALTSGKSIACMNLANTSIGPEGAAAMANALCMSKALKELNLERSPVGGDGAAHAANALAVNATLESICVSNFYTKGLKGFMVSLPFVRMH